jgi:hypothetical protein
MKQVLMVSPHFPPDTTAGTHRVRLLAPHLAAHGWQPTVLTVDPRDYEGRLDPELAELVPPTLRVLRCRALSPASTRLFGVGDLGLRAYFGLRQAARWLLAHERFDALFITLYPAWPALLGAGLVRRFGVPFVLDYQDPWVGAWGQSVGGGPGGRPDLKSRVSRWLAQRLEPRAVRAASALTAVSARTYEEIFERHPELRDRFGDGQLAAIPIGGEEADFETVRSHHQPNGWFDAQDGDCHLCYVGTLLPLGFETLRAVLAAVRLLRDRRPALYARLRLHFFGTSNQTTATAEERVLPVARELGVADRVSEHAPRVPYLDALRILTQATAVLLMGSSQQHYTASKLYPAILARRPLLAVYHAESSVTELLARAGRAPTVRSVSYTSEEPAGSRVEEIHRQLVLLIEKPLYRAEDLHTSDLDRFSASSLAGRLAAVLSAVTAPDAAASVESGR